MSETAKNALSPAAAPPKPTGVALLLDALRLPVMGRMSDMPNRVRTTIDRYDQNAEVVIRLAQLGAVLVFGTLYVLSPKTSEGTAFTPVPFVLLAYTLFASAGLIWAMRSRLPDIAVYMLTAVDVTLLMALIFSFHIQYEQPPSFYLKAPTLFHIFIFIALRALRLQARFVLAAGLFSVIGWGFLLGYAAWSEEGGMMVTRNYVVYMTENSILFGAEFDKMIVIVMVTIILAYAVQRGRTILINAIIEQAAARDLSRFFDPMIAEQIRSAKDEIAAGEGVTRDAAILNVDIRGFSRFAAERPANETVAILAEYQERLVPIIQAHGGTIDKFMGDGIMATFGATTVSETYAADAIRASDAVVAELDAWSQSLPPHTEFDPARVNLAVATGPIVFGAVGSDERLEFTIIGAAVNLSSKLEKHNKASGTRALATAETLDLAKAQGLKRTVDAHVHDVDVDGVSDPVSIAVLG